MFRRGIAALVIVAAAGMALGACSGPQTPEFGKPEVGAITKLVQDFQASYNAKDVDKTASVFSGSATLMPPNRSTLHGIEAIKEYYRNRFAEGATDLSVDIKEINGVGTLAYMTATFSYKDRPENGPESRNRGKFVWIVRNMGGGQWRCEYHIWNSDLPLPAPAPVEPESKPAGKNKKK
jgi:ketosteroid isomerase-like protein